MPLDITLFRVQKGGNPDLVKESQKRRFKSIETIDKIIELDENLRKVRYERDQTNQKLNELNKIIGKKKKANEGVEELMKEKREIEEKIKKIDSSVEEIEKKLEETLNQIGNIVHASVPVSDNEDNNKVEKQWGEFIKKPRHHHELLYMIDGYDSERGVNVASHRGYFLKGVGVQLNFALIQYGLDFLLKKNYILLQPPYMMKKKVMAQTAQLEQFDEELYKVIGTKNKIEKQEKELYLIATSEQPISAYHRGEWLESKQLPIKYGGISTCFRKEAGAHGKDTWGIFRVHQFEKVEQFCITSPETSWEMHEEMLKTSEEFFQSLGIPYRVVNIVSGALNNAASKKYDLEGWFPAFGGFRELVSCSNCTDYQSRAMEIRYGSVKVQGTKEKKYVHMLNGTLCATTRAICAILENYQTEEGIQIPEVLQPYMGGKNFIPFVFKEMPISKGEKGKKKSENKNKK